MANYLSPFYFKNVQDMIKSYFEIKLNFYPHRLWLTFTQSFF